MRQAPPKGQVVGPPSQLQPGGEAGTIVCLAILAFCFPITCFILGMHLYDTLIVFLLMILERLFEGGKQVSIILRNFPPILLEIFAEKGGLNQVIFLPLFRFFVPLITSGSNFRLKS